MDDPTRRCENDAGNETRLSGPQIPSWGPFYFVDGAYCPDDESYAAGTYSVGGTHRELAAALLLRSLGSPLASIWYLRQWYSDRDDAEG